MVNSMSNELEDGIDKLLTDVINKAHEKFDDSNWSCEARMLAVQNILLAELIQVLKERVH